MTSGCLKTFSAARPPRLLIALLLVLIGPLLGGCATVRVTDPPRTATEQFLLSEAAMRAVEQLATAALHDRFVFVDDEFFEARDGQFVLGELRAHLLNRGVRLAQTRADAEVILEIRSPGVGIDRYDYLLGLPPVLLPASSAPDGPVDVSSGTLIMPELAILKNMRQHSYASVAFVAYWQDTGEVLYSSGPFVGRAQREDWWFFGLGPRTTGDIPPVQDDEP